MTYNNIENTKMEQLLEALNWRYAVKKFDSTKKISEKDFEDLKTALQLSTSSYGLQLYKFLVVKNPNIREELVTASWGQTQVSEASHLVVFCIPESLEAGQIDEYVELTAKIRELPIDALQGFGDFMKKTLLSKEQEELSQWMAKQTYIALGNLLDAAAVKKIDACPMEGFDPEKYGEILGLKEKGLKAVLVTPLGYRSEEDKNQHIAKVRKSQEVLFEEIL